MKKLKLEIHKKRILVFYAKVIVLISNSSSSELEFSSLSELEFPSSDELDSYSSSSDDSDESGSLKKIVSHKGPSKDLQKWYEDKDEKDDYDEELWTPKSMGTSSKSFELQKATEKLSVLTVGSQVVILAWAWTRTRTKTYAPSPFLRFQIM
nr:hypothetical protein [Tanacetum cinerariifolium]